MLLLIWCSVLVSAAFAASTATEKDICSICECNAQILDCSNRNISIMLSLENRTNATTVSFNINLMTYVPVLPKLPVKFLSLARNEITHIEDSAFKNLASLVVLDLSYNWLNSDKLLPSIFRGKYAPDLYEPLRSLKELIISYNSIHSLHPNLFEHLPNLEKLSLKGNPLRIISHGTVSAIASLPFLKELDLSETGLKKLPDSLLHAPKELELLDLSYNQFTSPPEELENSHRIRWLSLSGNPIKKITKFPSMEFLQILHLSRMAELVRIEGRSLSTLPRLEEFYCFENPKLVKIDKTAFSLVESAQEGEGEVWPPLKVMVLNNNSLHSIENHLVGRWDRLTVIDIQNNPWMCDCENQWLVSTLAPMIEKKQPDLLKFVKCAEPTQMEGLFIGDLYHRKYQMRCLDYYHHTPEKDGRLLINVCILTIILTPFLMFAILYYKRYRKTVLRNQFNESYRYTPLNLLLARKFNYSSP